MDDVETITHGILDALTLNCDYFNSLDILESITMEDILLVYDVIKNSPHTKVIINPNSININAIYNINTMSNYCQPPLQILIKKQRGRNISSPPHVSLNFSAVVI